MCLPVLIVLTGCYTGRSNYSTSGGSYLSAPADSLTNPGRMMVYDANLEMVIRRRVNAAQKIEDIALSHKGYVLRTGNEYSSNRRKEVRLRVPASSLFDALKEIEALGRVKQRSLEGEDITDQYQDLKLRLENAEKARDRYLELLEKAQTVTDMLAVEKELQRVRDEIEELKGKLNKQQHLVAYSTVTVSYRPPVRWGPVGYVMTGVYHVVKFLIVWE